MCRVLNFSHASASEFCIISWRSVPKEQFVLLIHNVDQLRICKAFFLTSKCTTFLRLSYSNAIVWVMVFMTIFPSFQEPHHLRNSTATQNSNQRIRKFVIYQDGVHLSGPWVPEEGEEFADHQGGFLRFCLHPFRPTALDRYRQLRRHRSFRQERNIRMADRSVGVTY